jgi:hypothetical protein
VRYDPEPPNVPRMLDHSPRAAWHSGWREGYEQALKDLHANSESLTLDEMHHSIFLAGAKRD